MDNMFDWSGGLTEEQHVARTAYAHTKYMTEQRWEIYWIVLLPTISNNYHISSTELVIPYNVNNEIWQ